MEPRKLKVVFITAILSWLVFSCNSTSSPEDPGFVPGIVVDETPVPSSIGLPRTEEDVPRVSLEEALAAMQSGEAVIVDVRSPQAYQASHIPGAVSIPLGEIEINPAGLPLDKDRWIITYCT